MSKESNFSCKKFGPTAKGGVNAKEASVMNTEETWNLKEQEQQLKNPLITTFYTFRRTPP